jgi:hypothetical protein
MNYYNVMGMDEDEEKVFEDIHNELIQFIIIGAGICSGFLNTQEFQVMKYHEAINGPNGKLWKAKVAKEHQRIVDSGVFKPVKKSKVPEGVRLTDTAWVMKK